MVENWSRRKRTVVMGIVITLTLTVASTVAAIDTRPVGARAGDWVRANAGALPATLSELAEYPVPYRVAAFQAHTPELRSRLAREHYRAFLAQNDLNEDQAAVVEQLITILTPAAYTPTGRDQAQERLAGICPRIPTLFSREQAAALAVLGPGNPPEDGFVLRWARIAKRFLVAYSVSASGGRFEDCWCASETECPGCVILYQQICDPGGCTETWPGCGCGFAFTCDGLCEDVPGLD